LIPNPLLINSFQSGWSSIQLAHDCHLAIELPEISNSQHIVVIPLGKQPVDFEFVVQEHSQTISEHKQDYAEDGLPKQKLKQALEYIQLHLGENLSLSAIANELGMSQYYFCRLFKRSTGMSPHQYLIRQRIERAKHLLKQREQSITMIAMECGFANQSHFAKYFRQYMGMNPKQFCNL
jgi:AraC-like DNA-binding protein